MRHFVFLNVGSRGYSSYAGTVENGFEEQPLWVVSDVVPAGVVEAARHLAELTRGRVLPFSVTFQHDPDAMPLIAYGCFFAHVKDDKGRDGIVFVHVVELDEGLDLYPGAFALIERLSYEQLQKLASKVAQLAVSNGDPGQFLEKFCRALEKRIAHHRQAAPDEAANPGDIGVIEHDCVGAAAVAWLTFAHAFQSRLAGWRVFDAVVEGRPRTCVEPPEAGVYRASNILQRGVSAWLSDASASVDFASDDLEVPVDAADAGDGSEEGRSAQEGARRSAPSVAVDAMDVVAGAGRHDATGRRSPLFLVVAGMAVVIAGLLVVITVLVTGGPNDAKAHERGDPRAAPRVDAQVEVAPVVTTGTPDVGVRDAMTAASTDPRAATSSKIPQHRPQREHRVRDPDSRPPPPRSTRTTDGGRRGTIPVDPNAPHPVPVEHRR